MPRLSSSVGSQNLRNLSYLVSSTCPDCTLLSLFSSRFFYYCYFLWAKTMFQVWIWSHIVHWPAFCLSFLQKKKKPTQMECHTNKGLNTGDFWWNNDLLRERLTKEKANTAADLKPGDEEMVQQLNALVIKSDHLSGGRQPALESCSWSTQAVFKRQGNRVRSRQPFWERALNSKVTKKGVACFYFA